MDSTHGTIPKEYTVKNFSAKKEIKKISTNKVKAVKAVKAVKLHAGNPIKSTRKFIGITCILCGKKIPRGQILNHKIKFHKEAPDQNKFRSGGFSPNIWVHIHQGGLPS